MAKKEKVEVHRYTYDEVKKILCEGCKYKLPETFEPSNVAKYNFFHVVNEVIIPCLANDFRIKANQENHSA